MIETSVFEVRADDGRHIRIERDDAEVDRAIGHVLQWPATRLYIDDVEIDATDLACRHEDDQMVLLTAVGEIVISW